MMLATTMMSVFMSSSAAWRQYKGDPGVKANVYRRC
jgi:hypothetical protein